MFIAALYTIAELYKQPKYPSTDEWIKMWYIYVYIYGIYTHTHTHTHNGILFSQKKNETLPFATTWMDLEGIMLSKISQTEKDKYCI